MSCIPCSKVSTKQIDVVKYYKDLYKKKGLETYFYRLKTGGDLLIVNKSGFNAIFLKKIKPNFENGAEYFFVDEFKV